MAPEFIPGIELSRRCYVEFVRPLLQAELGDTPHSAALLGWGSDVQGYDTARSTDHGWGPRVQVFLPAPDLAARGEELHMLLDRQLPETFYGYSVRFPVPDGAEPRHWVDFLEARTCFTQNLGADPEGMTVQDWLLVPTQVLREMTAGVVHHDGLGVLGRYREALAWYPDDVWRYVLACQWTRLSQEEPFVGRCGEVGDELGSAVVAARQVRDLMKLCLLMARVYPPYSKWLGTAFARLDCAAELTPLLTGALAAGTWQERERHLTPAYVAVAEWHNRLALTEYVEPSVRNFWSRPFQVLHSFRFADALVASISDPRIRNLPLYGAVDQYVDSTDVTDSDVEVLRALVAGPRRR